MKLNHYTVEDFLSDQHFVDWVKGAGSREKHIYFDQWIKSNPKNLDALLLAREIILSLTHEALNPDQEDYDDVLSNIINAQKEPQTNRTYDKKKITTSFRTINPFWIRAAILLLLFIGSFILYKVNQTQRGAQVISQKEIIKENPKGQRSKIRLPDGSIVWLNAESEIRYLENFEGKTRLIELRGEAFFEVKKDTTRPFIVKSGSITTTALGTSFNIHAFDLEKEIEVALVHGKVEVEDTTTEVKLILLPGEMATGNNPEYNLKKSLFKYEDEILWKEGVIYFNNENLEGVMDKLSRWYNVEFKVINYPTQTWIYNGSFNNTSLEQILKRMSFTEDFGYEMNNKVITIKFKE